MMFGGRDRSSKLKGYVRRKSGVFVENMRPDLQEDFQGTVTTITGQPRNEPSKSSGLGKSWRDRSPNSSGARTTESQDVVADGGISKSVEVTYEEMEVMEGGGLCAVKKV